MTSQKIKSEFLIQDIYEAYRKLKSYYYYDNTSLFIRKQIAEFEKKNFSDLSETVSDEDFKKSFFKTFEPLLKILNSDNPGEDGLKGYLERIDYKLTPKSIEKKTYNFITNRPQEKELIVDKCNFLIDAPIEIHIISVLWLMFVGKKLNKQISNNNYAYQLLLSDNAYTTDTGIRVEDDSKSEDEDTVVSGLQLYRPYFIGYQAWRDNALKKALDLLDDKKDVVILSLDIKRYFYSVRLSIKEIYEDSIIIGTLDKEDKLSTKLCGFLQAVNWKYTQVVEELLDDKIEPEDLKNERGLLPIGLLSSGFLGNFYLNFFDDKIIDILNPAYYGRYVDDILFVFNDREIDHRDEDPLSKFVEKYFINRQILEKRGNTKEVEFIFTGKPNLTIQLDKIILEDFSHKESRAAINQFKRNLEKQRSEFRFLPDEDKVENEFDNEAFLLQYSDSVNKLRSIKEYREDKFGASKFLANKIFLSCYSSERNSKDSKRKFHRSAQQILSFFKGRIALDFHTLWEKVATYFIINNEVKCLSIFINQINKAIDNITLDHNISFIKNKIKEDLRDFLNISIAIPLSMNSFYDDFDLLNIADSFRFSNMFRHNLVGISAINYTNGVKDSYNLYNTSVSELPSEIWENKNNDQHISSYLSPRFVHFNELNILESYISLLGDKGDEINSKQVLIRAEELYQKINYKWRYLYVQVDYKPKSHFFDIEKIEITTLKYKQEIKILDSVTKHKTKKSRNSQYKTF